MSCGGSFESAYSSAVKGMSGQALFDELLRLDQAYPDRLKLKLEIGARFLAAGDLNKAKTYLESGERRIGLFAEPRLKYSLFADLALLRLREGNNKEALACAVKAIAASPKDELGVVFTKAHAEYALKDVSVSLKDFDKGWKSHRASMGVEDFRVYASALIEGGRDADAIQVLGEYQKKYPYDPGVGLLESGCYERIGDFTAAILCAFKEYEYERAFGFLAGTTIQEALDSALNKVATKTPAAAKDLGRVVSCIKAYLDDDWRISASTPSKGFGEYIATASKLESGSSSPSDLESYLLLEPSMKSFQAYYFHLWRGLRQDERSYSSKTARRLLETCIALAPSSPMALESRRELGRVLGIGEAAGGKLLVPAELDAIFSDLVAGAPFSRLDPVMALLDTPDNDYQFASMYALGKASADPAMRSYLAAREKSSSGKLRERLTYILSM
jgi:tetratricopeptide (TPR) repeat protein